MFVLLATPALAAEASGVLASEEPRVWLAAANFVWANELGSSKVASPVPLSRKEGLSPLKRVGVGDEGEVGAVG
jgi:hypothetical protein